MQCMAEQGHPSNELHFFEFKDDGNYEIYCNQGHRSITVLQQQKYEILFEIGANAIIDGYYREAVSSFMSSLERFYEFCLRVICEKRGIQANVVSAGWKEVSILSERQLGAFIFLWISEFGEVPKILSKKNTAFRNKVIHGGKIPTRAEAVDYGEEILSIIQEKITDLKATCSEEVQNVVFHNMISSVKNNADNTHRATMHIPTILNLVTSSSRGSETLVEGLEWIKERRVRIKNIELFSNEGVNNSV